MPLSVLSGCGFGKPHVFSIELVNITGQTIDEFDIFFGDRHIGRRQAKFDDRSSAGEHGLSGSIPATITAKWKTLDGKSYESTVDAARHAPKGCDWIEVRFLKNGTVRVVYRTYSDNVAGKPAFYDPKESEKERVRRLAGDELCEAAERGDLQAVQRLIETGADVNSSLWGYAITPLEKACLGDNHEVARFLLNRGATIGRATQLAAQHAGPEMLNILLANGANLEVGTEEMDSPLFRAIDADKTANVRWLLEHGADANAGHKTSWTPIYKAYPRNSEITRLLLQYGADPNIKTGNKNETVLKAAMRAREAAIHYERHLQLDAIVKLLQDAGGKE